MQLNLSNVYSGTLLFECKKIHFRANFVTCFMEAKIRCLGMLSLYADIEECN
jgi:hypothetical protein